ncbi:MAG: hypothetical protein QT08_C0014G0021 [archaeon GW2011_AR17]|nr:MAG: hypothetical protein QT08_C0014G0021 [archaeon GW2011_AR17]MBS3154779.1 hypothetical protein [Candidatus Woesearchaeota archaeon]HIH14916.1 hypothetical protein [Nanoarchaeota archaeon]HIH58464.1 hypothetical protein [Nanoarchaeota archaeon]HII13536.1 hypothetical protein [Nanoarchaeota archaeon]
METVRDRLVRLKNTSFQGGFEPRREERPKEDKFLTPESQYMKKVEKAIAQVESLRTKMHSGTDQYISLYQELKVAEDEFVKLLIDPEQKFMDLPTAFISKVDNTKKKLLTKKF